MVSDEPTADYSERAIRTVLVVDVAESVRLMEEGEQDTVSRWRSFVQGVTSGILPTHGGRLVKSLGDGMLIDFPCVQEGVKAAFEIQNACMRANQGMPPERQIRLRMGIQVSELISDEHDVYGRGVNLAARLATLAGPSEIVVSANVREQLTPVLDADIDDLGECYLKHIREPVRAYRVGPPGPRPVIEPGDTTPELRPTIAVIPFSYRGTEGEHVILGEILADDVISALSQTADLHVISRLSTTVFRGRNATLDDISMHLHATYVLSGAYRTTRDQLVVAAELAEAKSGRVVWATELKGKITSVVAGTSDLAESMVKQVSTALIARELERAQTQSLPTLESYTLLLSAITLMHRLSLQDFERARQMLDVVVERVPRQAVPLAWLAKWHVLRVQQGWTEDSGEDANRALQCTRRALDADENCTLALAVDGCVHTNLLKRLDIGLSRYEHALRVNPNDSLAWLFKGTLHAFKGEGEPAVKATQRALKLSPLDPHRYFYDSLAATVECAAKRYDRAIEAAKRSLRLNRKHSSTLRALAVAQWNVGQEDEARATIAELMRLEPGYTISKFLERSPSSEYETGKEWSKALRSAGVPE
jgi:class 3 adenylate cyclase/TolB-like protein/Tfp pilus assembly protein PilF